MQVTSSISQVDPTGGEERYADGFAEYGSLFGGPTHNYDAPSNTAQSPAAQFTSADLHRKRIPSTISDYQLGAPSPTYRKDTEGLQLANPHTSNGQLPAYDPGLMVDPRYLDNQIRRGMSPPAPLKFGSRGPGVQDPRGHMSPPSPQSPGFQSHTMQPALLSPTAMSPLSHQMQSPSSAPPPLRFLKRTPTLPPTPPMSMGGNAADEYGFPERIQSLRISNGFPEGHRYAMEPPSRLSRMNTVSSRSSGRSSTHISSPVQSIPASPFGHPRPYSAALSVLSTTVETPAELNPTDAQAEILRRLGEKKDKDLKAASTTSKRGFSLKRSTTTTTGHSQDELTDMLEEVASEGNLSLVKAVLALGADPIYRSSGKLKKVKHEALGKATLNGHANVVALLLQKGATYGDASKKGTFAPIDRALLAAVYKEHAELALCLISAHNANPMVEQWPREMHDTQHYWAESQVRLSKTSVLDGISRWKNVDNGLLVLAGIMKDSRFSPTALVSGVFDTKSELQTAEFNYRPWQTTYQYSALACFVRAGWADPVEQMLSDKGAPTDYEKEDEVLQYQDKVTRTVSPINALTKETWEKRPDDSLRILRILLERGFSVSLAQRTATDMGSRSALSRAISADAAQGVELILQHKPVLVREEISFRRHRKETKALPFAAALSLGSLESARVLLRAGAHARDPAFDKMNNLQFAASNESETTAALLGDMIAMAPELTYDALDIAIKKLNLGAVKALLEFISVAAMRDQIAQLPPVYDMILLGDGPGKEDASESKYLQVIDMINAWDAGGALERPQLPVLLSTIRKDNFVGLQRLLKLRIVDGRSLALNSKGQPLGEQGVWTVLECCELTNRSNEWMGLLRHFGAPLY